MQGPTTSESQVELNWNTLATSAETGGATILSYEVQWDRGYGNGSYYALAGYSSDYTASSFTVTSDISPGQDFTFRIRGKNMWGWGPYSSLLTSSPSAVPAQMATVYTWIEAERGDVVFNWTAPADNSAAITAYKIEILDKAGSAWSEETTYCNGSNQYVMGNRSCVIPMSVFSAVPLSLALGDLITVRASAYNVNGWGPTSVPTATKPITDPNPAATLQTIPTTMNAPVRDPSSSDTQIMVTWTALTNASETGASVIQCQPWSRTSRSRQPWSAVKHTCSASKPTTCTAGAPTQRTL